MAAVLQDTTALDALRADTTYVRALTGRHLELTKKLLRERRQKVQAAATSPLTALSGEQARAEAAVLDDIVIALERAVHGEAMCMPIVCAGWERRKAALDIKGKTADRDREAYMQGALAALVGAGVLPRERAEQIAFLTAIGRLQEYMAAQCAKSKT